MIGILKQVDGYVPMNRSKKRRALEGTSGLKGKLSGTSGKMSKENKEIHIKISPDVKQRLRAHAVSEYPNECCGILLGRQTEEGDFDISDIFETENWVREEQCKREFLIDPMAIYRCELSIRDRDLIIVGFYHSHPDKPAVLSAKDKEGMIPGQVYVLMSVSKRGCENASAFINTGETGKALEARCLMNR